MKTSIKASKSKTTNRPLGEHLIDWFDLYGRKDLPWQQNRSAYKVWVSEIMLQQTQVATVIPYFERFMASFPTLETLAQASIDNVLEHWAGLGYYARGRNLHKTARQLISQNQFTLPDDIDALIALPGIGKSTAGAILSMGHGVRAPILDGNVKRVLSRLKMIEGWPGKKDVENQLWILAEEFTPIKRFDDYTQAIMDLGATLCKRSKPNCMQCPWQHACLAYASGKVSKFPYPKPKKMMPVRTCWMLDITNADEQSLFIKRPPTGIWGGLWCLPQLESSYSDEEIIEYCKKGLGLSCSITSKKATFRHTFSHFHLDICVVQLTAKTTQGQVSDANNFSWQSKGKNLALPAPITQYFRH